MSSVEPLKAPAEGLRNRASKQQAPVHSNSPIEKGDKTDKDDNAADRQAKVLGRTPDGTLFTVPHTPDMLSSIFDPRQPKTPLDILTIVALTFQLLLYFILSRRSSQIFFFLYFTFWRASYNAGLGYILKQQSEKGWIIRQVKHHGWLDPTRRPRVHTWVKQQLVTKMDPDYVFEAMPMDYNVWLMFRSIVDVVLLNDFVAYSLFAFSCTRLPEGHSLAMHLLRWVAGCALIFFNLWVKVDAHRVVKDYAWYWGDCFFLCLQSLVFDGVYEIVPDPMYSIGYAGYYGLSLVSGSYAVLFVSLAAHASQFLFMTFFEGPHIERTYGERKPIAVRVPLRQAPFNAASRKAALSVPPEEEEVGGVAVTADAKAGGGVVGGEFENPSPSQTEASTALTTEDEISEDEQTLAFKRTTLRSSSSSNDAIRQHSHPPSSRPITTLHDLHHRIFRKDTVVYRNLDPMRANDLLLIVASLYSLFPLILPTLGRHSRLTLLFVNALIWRVFHSFGLGLALRRQSESKWVIRHFLKHYHYTQPSDAVFEAFANWKIVYNTSLVLTYISFSALAFNCYTPIGHPDWTVGPELLRHTLGLLLIALHIWTANSSYQVLGPFGWLYGDFFVDEYPHQLYYTGIYRFLNNPERSMGGAAFFGLTLISGSKLTLTMAIISYISHWIFLSSVEGPHMRKLYGEAALRKDSGLTKQLKSQWVAARGSDLFKLAQESTAVRNVQGTIEKVQKDAAEVFEEFFKQSRPRLEGMLEETKVLLQQSKDRLLIVRVDADLNSLDRSKYDLEVNGGERFHLGQKIQVRWKAPGNHSRRDWIGIYLLSRLGSVEKEGEGESEGGMVTKISSQGKWVGVVEDEWEGDAPQSASNSSAASKGKEEGEAVSGVAVLSGNKLPWTPGFYELRYHHDAKHNVLARSPPIEIYVNRLPPSLSEAEELDKTAEIIREIVRYSTPATNPTRLSITSPQPQVKLLSKQGVGEEEAVELEGEPLVGEGKNRDDFTIWDRDQAGKISKAIKWAFHIELSPEVIIAEANVKRLALDVVEGRRVLQRSLTPLMS